MDRIMIIVKRKDCWACKNTQVLTSALPLDNSVNPEQDFFVLISLCVTMWNIIKWDEHLIQSRHLRN